MTGKLVFARKPVGATALAPEYGAWESLGFLTMLDALGLFGSKVSFVRTKLVQVLLTYII